MKPFDSRSLERLSALLSEAPGRHAILHLLGGSTVQCTAVTYAEVKDQGGGLRSREVTVHDAHDPQLVRSQILADAIIGFEVRNGPRGAQESGG